MRIKFFQFCSSGIAALRMYCFLVLNGAPTPAHQKAVRPQASPSTKLKKIICSFLIFLGFILNFTSPLTVQAQSGSFSGTNGELTCRNASRDWLSFLSAVISYDDFVEYFRDITGWPPLFVNSRYTVNICMFMDIDNLLNQIKKVREQIRKAFYACDANVDKLKATYFRLEAELFFLRKYVRISDGTMAEVNPDEVLRDLNAYFVLDKRFLSADEMKTLFEQFKNKYQSRIKTYADCKDPTWESLLLKLTELKDHITGGLGIKSSAGNVANAFDKAINTPYQRTGNVLGGLLDAKINDVEPWQALSDIGAKLKEQFPKGFTFEQLQAAQREDLIRYNDAISRESYLAQYDVLYRQSSGEIVKSVLDRLEYLQSSLKNTFPFINQTIQCTKGILDKAC